MAIVTIDDVLPYLTEGTFTLSANDNTLLTSLIDGVEQFVEKYISSPLSEIVKTEYISGKRKPFIRLRHIPTGSIEVYIDENKEFPPESLLDPSTYEVLPLRRTVERVDGDVFPRGNRNIKVVYTTGWTSANLPSDLKMVICDVVANTFYHIRNKTESTATRAGMGTSVTFIQDKFILPNHLHILNNYRSHSF